jgi:ribosomal protein S4E
MMRRSAPKVVDGAACTVTAGTHAGKAGIVRDVNASDGGHVTTTVEQAGGTRFKTLAKNVVMTEPTRVPR